MKGKLIAKTSITINATAAEVWKAITDPAAIQQYLMGTKVKTDWKEGSPISYTGEYHGKQYHDKGIIQKIEPEHVFQSTYWSSMGGQPDLAENYNLVTYKLGKRKDCTLLTLTQDNVKTELEKTQAVHNWKAVLQKLKSVVEN